MTPPRYRRGGCAGNGQARSGKEKKLVVGYLMVSLVVAILGVAAVVSFLRVALSRLQRRAELDRKNAEISSSKELEDFIRQVNQSTSAEELDHLDEKKERGN